ncbi:MAG: uncharacterized protein KVP18_000254 [Porospora cf. gigantea A]|uniref:uncharacterized protein n=1 Tax=Porospora cf. gigantea A TaxID=2853593 RepID=UPI00355A5076|nr:MAG: hypothetical protein KVP18_000254 [Porospora cf. gigantea A]
MPDYSIGECRSTFKPLEVVIESDAEDDDFATVTWKPNPQLRQYLPMGSAIRKPTASPVGSKGYPSTVSPVGSSQPALTQNEVVNHEVQSSSNSNRLHIALQDVADLLRSREQLELRLTDQIKKSFLLRSTKEIKNTKTRLNWVNANLDVALKKLARCPMGDGTPADVTAALEQNDHTLRLLQRVEQSLRDCNQHRLGTMATGVGRFLKFLKSSSRSK